MSDNRPLLVNDDGDTARPEPRRWYVLFVYSYISALQSLLWITWSSVPGPSSRRRDCHFADIPSPHLSKHLLKVEGDAAE